jgi:DNA polymerase-3 subunit gamma/tau
MTPDRDARLAEQAQRVARVDVVRLLELLADALGAIKDGAEARTQLELALVKAAAPEVDPSAKALLARIERLERGAPRAAAPPPPANGAAPTEAPGAAAAHATADAIEEVREAEPIVEAAVEAIPPPSGELDLGAVRDVWPAVLEAVRGRNGMLAAVLAESRPCDLTDDELVVGFPPDKSFLCRKAEDNRQVLAESLRETVGRPLRVRCELREDEDGSAGVTATPALSEDELVERFKSEFEAEEIVPGDVEVEEPR